jgi:hypothetical protein
VDSISPWSRRAAAAILVAGWAAMLAWGAPGQLSYDSVVQLADGRSGHYDTWHPPVMAALMGLFDRILPGTLLFLLFMSGLALLALLWLVWLKPKPGWGVAAVALIIVLTPQWLLYQTNIWKDVLFADAALAGFAALARAADAWPGRPWLTAAGLLLCLAAMTRQNGIVLLPVAAVTLGLIAARHVPRRTAIGVGAGFLLATGVLSFAADAVLIAHGDGGAGAAGELRYVQTYDLAGAVSRNPAVELDRLKRADPKMEGLLRTHGAMLYSTRQLDSLIDDSDMGDAIDDAPPGAIFAQWRDLVLHHPRLYLEMRWPVFWQVLATPDVAACHPIFTGIDGAPATLRGLGLTARHTPRALALARYAGAFIGSPLFSHLAFAALAVALLGWLLRRGLSRCSGPDLAVAGLMAGALLFSLTFLIVSVACDYRYLYALDLSALAGALYAARGFRRP